ncbi:addiction module antidote protein HigA [Leptospira borgpetersenii serovar Hardjo-bovis str. Sponselee]|uniref:Addiction module antidote protein HigA n=1 Tax=Leptospira borgpetersenii serovar Hardjo-bovis str. Sponselee TaxID=1303729 RepID=M6BZ86_LEPBO|nr:addiction module antidote protein HigA [Leptospira borgpetersenii serovar Hardjo-bovis str. Sponselee]
MEVIENFTSFETEKIWKGEYSKKISRRNTNSRKEKLRTLNNTFSIEDLKSPPGNRLEMLKRNRKDQYNIRINDQWRICFRWSGSNALNIEIVDYHDEVKIMKRLLNIHLGSVLEEELLIPLEISAYRLAKKIGIPHARISQIIQKNVVYPQTPQFGFLNFLEPTPQFWLELQNDYISKKKRSKKERIRDDSSVSKGRWSFESLELVPKPQNVRTPTRAFQQ